ncbi:winged helix-turn-helix domain-containing protein [Actinopolymorpha pittospori]
MGRESEIRHNAPTPPYRQLAALLAARIRAGEWEPDTPIPSEPQLVGDYGVARNTVRKAIALLVEEGLVFVVPHRGTFVKP